MTSSNPTCAHKFPRLIIMVLIFLLAGSYTNAESVEDGEQLFASKCAACHTIGSGDSIGPDLVNLFDHRDPGWVRSYISDPDRLKAEGDPAAVELGKNWSMSMPKPGLSDDEMSLILEYLGADPAVGEISDVQIPEGDPAAGAGLFNGTSHFTNGGQACVNCHSMGGSGGSLGPGLDGIYEKSGESGLYALLGALPYPTMKPLYDIHPLTDKERSDLTTFLAGKSAGNSGPVGFSTSGLIGVVVLLFLISFIWKDRLTGVRKNLVEKYKIEKGISR